MCKCVAVLCLSSQRYTYNTTLLQSILSRYANVVETTWERGVLGVIALLRMRTDQIACRRSASNELATSIYTSDNGTERIATPQRLLRAPAD